MLWLGLHSRLLPATQFDSRSLLSTQPCLLARNAPATENSAEHQDQCLLPVRKFFNIADKQNIQMADLQGNEMQFLQIKLLAQTAYPQH